MDDEVLRRLYPSMYQFDPEGDGYDDFGAQLAGMRPDETGHMGSVREASEDERKLLNLPDEAYLVLKGRKHETFHKTEKAEAERGFKIIKLKGRYWSVPAAWEGGK
jgi:hypothetical protein